MTAAEKEDKKYLAKCCMLDLLLEVDRICRENNIRYTLSNGSLLGAAKYNGFIPWDDDVDVALIRSEYDKFIECCEKCLGSEYRLVNAENEEGNPNLYYKIKIKGTTYVEGISSNTAINREVYLDVFPYDKTPNNYLLGIINQAKIDYYRRLLSYKCGAKYSKNRNILKRLANSIVRKMSNYYHKDILIAKMKLLMTKYNSKDSKYVINPVGTYSYKKERMKLDYFKDYINTDFEGYTLSASKNYDDILKNMYGDYSIDPPESEKRSRHEVSAISVGGYTIKHHIGKEE